MNNDISYLSMSKRRQSQVSYFFVSSESQRRDNLLIKPTFSTELGILSEKCGSNNLKVLTDKILNSKDARYTNIESKRKIKNTKYDASFGKADNNETSSNLSIHGMQSVFDCQSKPMREITPKTVTETIGSGKILSCQAKSIKPTKLEIVENYYNGNFKDINSSQSDCELSNTTSKTQATSNLSQALSTQEKLNPDCKNISLGPSGLFQLDEARQNTDSKAIEEDNREGDGSMQFVDIQRQSSTFSTVTNFGLNSNNPDERMMRAPDTLRNLLKDISSSIASSHRMNACGALKCICLIPQNRNRLAHTQGVVFMIVNMIYSKNAGRAEKIRLLHALIYLCKEKCNHEVILRDEDIRDKLGNLLLRSIESPTCQMISYCISLLASKNINRKRMIENDVIMRALTSVISKKEHVLEQRRKISSRAGNKENTQCNNVDKGASDEAIDIFHKTKINSLTTILSLSKNRNIAVSSFIKFDSSNLFSTNIFEK